MDGQAAGQPKSLISLLFPDEDLKLSISNVPQKTPTGTVPHAVPGGPLCSA